jgi:hypothetical protein
MAKANTNKTTKSTAKKSTSPAPKKTTAVRNTAIPRKSSAANSRQSTDPTQDQIAQRAFEIYASGNGGSAEENWHRAQRELRGL